ncbi:MAG: helix-turn-helix domain-containing protein [Phycisphaerae bacterium]|nr:helix-turn-helix domain-containing protein [Phycisphaerae bacterium]
MNEQPLLLKPRDAARLLAISERKLWQLTNCREIPAVRIGRAVRYSLAELRAWTEARGSLQRRTAR